MSTFLRSLRKSASSEDLMELQQIVTRLDAQKQSLEQLVQHADRSIGQLQRLGTLGERVNALEHHLAGMEQTVARLDAVESRLAGLAGTHQRLEAALEETARSVEATRTEATTAAEVAARSLALKEDLSAFLVLEGPFRQLRADMDGLQSHSESLRADLVRLRDQHDKTQSQYRAASGRIEAFDTDWQRVARTLTEAEHRIAGLEQLMADMAPVAEGVAQTRRQLTGARTAADQLGQKVALLEQQRDQIDRATAKLEHLTALMQLADAGLERQADIVRTLSDLRVQLDQLNESQAGLEQRARGTAERMDRIEAGQGAGERNLLLIREGLDQSVERLALESRSIEGVAQRIGDLRRSLNEWEGRFNSLAASAEAITTAAARADSLGAQVAGLSGEFSRVAELGHRARAGLNDLERLEENVAGLTERTCRIEEMRPLLDRTVRDLQSLTATDEAIQDALEQLRAARQELADSRGRAEAARGWLTETERQMAALQQDVAGLDRMRATVDDLRREVQQLAASTDIVEARRDMVEDVQRRVLDAASVASTIEDRARSFADRLTTAELQLESLGPSLEDAGRVGHQLLALGADLREVEQRIRGVQGTMDGLEERAEELSALGGRMQDLAREVEQRQNAVARTMEHLDRAVAMRQEAAEAAHALAERARDIHDLLEGADGRLERCSALSEELEERLGSLATLKERIDGFDARMSEWRGAEQQLAQSMEQAAMRQATVSALQGEIRALFEVAERTQADARAVADAQPRLARTRAELDALLDRLGDSDGILHTLDERRRQLDRTEERLAHADTLLADVRASLELILAQKAQVDHFLEKAQALSLETRRVEGLLETLREERRVTDRIQTALSDLRRQEDAATREAAAEA